MPGKRTRSNNNTAPSHWSLSKYENNIIGYVGP